MEQQKTISKSEKRWLIREIESGRMSLSEARQHIAPVYKDPGRQILYWQKQFSSDIILTLPVMTEREKQKLQALQKRLKTLEKQLEDAQMKNIALETMIDLAEEQLRIPIRKKSGPKQ
ncbi:hypothetical protein [Thiomicrospira sp.]|uniref:hypothetical protein n=1 Tax=Thiomicrospira sp. TaxID=935 RepID=UPI002F9236F0